MVRMRVDPKQFVADIAGDHELRCPLGDCVLICGENRFPVEAILKGEDADFRKFMESGSCSVIRVERGDSKPRPPIVAEVVVNNSQFEPGESSSSCTIRGIEYSLVHVTQFAGLGVERLGLSVAPEEGQLVEIGDDKFIVHEMKTGYIELVPFHGELLHWRPTKTVYIHGLDSDGKEVVCDGASPCIKMMYGDAVFDRKPTVNLIDKVTFKGETYNAGLYFEDVPSGLYVPDLAQEVLVKQCTRVGPISRHGVQHVELEVEAVFKPFSKMTDAELDRTVEDLQEMKRRRLDSH